MSTISVAIYLLSESSVWNYKERLNAPLFSCIVDQICHQARFRIDMFALMAGEPQQAAITEFYGNCNSFVSSKSSPHQ